MTQDINEAPTLMEKVVRGCEAGLHQLDPNTADFFVSGDKMIVEMLCTVCSRKIRREEAAAALIPGFVPEEKQPEPERPQQQAAPQPAQQQQMKPQVVVVREAPLYEGAKQSDDFWDQIKE